LIPINPTPKFRLPEEDAFQFWPMDLSKKWIIGLDKPLFIVRNRDMGCKGKGKGKGKGKPKGK
jgi:hypothetical protein